MQSISRMVGVTFLVSLLSRKSFLIVLNTGVDAFQRFTAICEVHTGI